MLFSFQLFQDGMFAPFTSRSIQNEPIGHFQLRIIAIDNPCGDVVAFVFLHHTLDGFQLILQHPLAYGPFLLAGTCPCFWVIGENVDMESFRTSIPDLFTCQLQPLRHGGSFDGAIAPVDGDMVAIGDKDKNAALWPFLVVVQADEGILVNLHRNREMRVLNGN